MTSVSPKFEIEDLQAVLQTKEQKDERQVDASERGGFTRSIVTFMRRSTPMSTAQKNALAEQSHLVVEQPFSRAQNLFEDTSKPVTIEIGFGMGTTLVEMAKNAPERNFLGIEVHVPGIGQCLHEAKEAGVTNLKVMNGDAIEILRNLEDNSVDTIQLYFPDPWQKRKHYKRRFVLPERMSLIAQKLKQGGLFHSATDWEHYAYWMVAVMDMMPQFENIAGKGKFHPRPDFRPYTKFEKRGIHSGHGVWDVMYRKI